MKCYVAVSGEYSDFHVNAVFLDKDLADSFVNVGGASHLMEFTVDVPKHQWVTWSTSVEGVIINGKVENVTVNSEHQSPETETPGPAFCRYQFLNADLSKEDVVSCVAYGSTEEHSKKVALDTFWTRVNEELSK